MNKSNVIDLNSLNVDELRAITENAQQLIAQKQHQRLYDAYTQFEKIAEESNASIEEILQAGEKLNTVIPTMTKKHGLVADVNQHG